MAAIEKDVTQAPAKAGYSVIGSRPIRHDGVDKVTGRAQYGSDLHMPGMLYGKVLRSPHAHARIVAIDTSAAEALPGVKAVVTAVDLPQVADKLENLGESVSNLSHLSWNCLAHGKVLYDGHAVAAVAAVNAHVAEEAIGLIKVDYDVLPAVLDGRAAMADDAPILLDALRTDELGKTGDKPTNIASHLQHKRGDVEAGFAAADVIVARTFHTATVHQGYIEPQNGTALWHDDGHIDVWSSTQGAFGVRSQVADTLKVPVSQVTATPTEIGGGFGGKLNVYLEPVAALLSKKAGHRPVKMTMGRADVLKATGPTSGSYITVKVGATKDGRITAAQAELIYEGGAFPTGAPIGAGATVILAPYRLDNVQIDGYSVAVNRPPASAYRAPGGTNAAFASETVMDEIAEQLGIDPLEFRVINGVQEGDRRPDGPLYPRVGYLEMLDRLKSHPHYTTPLEGPYRGRGVAVGFWGNWGGRSSASASVNNDGTVSLVEGSTDIGGSRASLAMQLAETLGIGAYDVHPRVVDTDSVGYNDVTGGSRTTYGTGWAVYTLGLKLIESMKARAADLWDVDAADVAFDHGRFSHNGDSLTFKELAEKGGDTPVAATATVHPKEHGPGFAAHCVDVEVDPETGKVTILRYTAAQDVGTAIHPSYVEGQIQGAVAQGIGWALNEEYVYSEDGRLLNASLLDYRMPTALDLPMIDCLLVEDVPNTGHPYGVRGVGEVPIVPPAAAVANAIYNALGIRMTELPMSPPNLMEAVWAKNGQ